MTTTTERSEITLSPSKYGNSLVRIEQDTDIVLVDYEDVEEFVAAVRKHAGMIKEPEPTPEKWYVVLRHSNHRLFSPGTPPAPMIFTDYDEAKRYGEGFSGIERIYSPVSVDYYERVFGR